MKKLFILGAIVLMVGITAKVSAQTASATASALVSTGIQVSKVTDLDFGSFVPSTTQPKVVLVDVATGSRTGSTATLIGSTTGQNASFHIEGIDGQTVTVTIPPSITINNGSNSMVITTTNSGTSYTLTGGAADVTIGGSLAVAASQATGSYTGTFSVTANY